MVCFSAASLFASLVVLCVVAEGPNQIKYPTGQRVCNEDLGETCTYTGANGGWLFMDEHLPHAAPHAAVSKSYELPTTDIFITIASFRDRLCPRTLYNIFHKAEYPDRVRVAVVQQNNPTDDIDCLVGYCVIFQENNPERTDCPRQDQVFMERIHYKDAKGPVFARSIASDMIPDDAEFCMQVDAHMDFLPGFDTAMLNMWGSVNNEYGVLSTYVSDITTYEEEAGGLGVNDRHEVPHLCMIRFHGGGQMPRNWGTKCIVRATQPKLTNALWGAGLSFSKCHAERKAPNDPNLPFVFDGEEFSKAARLWTHGYDTYSPHRVYVFHDYHASQGDPKHSAWSSNQKMRGPAPPILSSKDDKLLHKHHVMVKTEAQAWMRIRALINMPNDYDHLQLDHLRKSKFGLGDRRSINQLMEFSGLNTTQMQEQVSPWKCANLELVRFQQHTAGEDYIPHFDEWDRPVDPYDEGSIYYLENNPTNPKVVEGFQYAAQPVAKGFLKSTEKAMSDSFLTTAKTALEPGGVTVTNAQYNNDALTVLLCFFSLVCFGIMYKRFFWSKVENKAV